MSSTAKAQQNSEAEVIVLDSKDEPAEAPAAAEETAEAVPAVMVPRRRIRPPGQEFPGAAQPALAQALSQPRADLADLQPPRPQRGARPAHAAARTGQVPGHLRHDPRRVHHEADRRPQAAGRRRRSSLDRRRPYAAAADRRLPGRDRRDRGPQAGLPISTSSRNSPATASAS